LVTELRFSTTTMLETNKSRISNDEKFASSGDDPTNLLLVGVATTYSTLFPSISLSVHFSLSV
jgi:hypothetical protein